MAQSARQMFIVGIVEAAITLAGVILVLATLLYTKRAAIAAESAVVETRRIGEAQVRAYLAIKSVKFVFMGQTDPLPMVQITVVNTGQSPAQNFEWLPTIEYQTERGAVFEPFDEAHYSGVGTDIGASRKHKAKFFGTLPLVTTISRHMEMPEAVCIRVQVHYRWTDVFGNKFTEYRTYMGMAEKGLPDENIRDVHPLNDGPWACLLEPVPGDGEGVILVKAKDSNKGQQPA